MPVAARRTAALLLLAGAPLALGHAAFAQERPPAPSGPPSPTAPAGQGDGESAPDPAAVAQRIAKLWERIARDPPPILASETDKEKLAAVAAAHRAFRADLAALNEAADLYAKALAGAPGDPRALWQAGYGRARHAEKSEDLTKEARLSVRSGAAAFLQAALDGAPKEADYRADAEYWLGRMHLFQAEAGRASLPQAVEHLRTATLLFRKATRLDESGEAALAALKSLVARGMDAEARDFSSAIGAATEDFGGPTERVRVLGRRGGTAVGSPFPGLPDTTDADGKPFRWADLRGAPFVVHLFHATNQIGQPSGERDVETLLRPLWDRLHAKGLRMVGVSMDLALPKERVEKLTKDWEEFGRKGRVQDGGLECVRRHAEEQGIAWPWLWDGLWGKNPVSQALGGPGVSAPHAVLVDAQGVIRWRGDSPFTGLAEAVDAAVAASEKK